MKKTKRKPVAKPIAKGRRRGRNPSGGRPLSFDAPAKEVMPSKRAAKQRVRASINRVIAECDRVDAALIEITRATQPQDPPPLAIAPIETGDGGAARGWAVVSGDPQKPLTEQQARDIVAALQSRGTPAASGIAAE